MNAAAIHFTYSTLTVAFFGAAVIPRSYLGSTPTAFKAMIESFNNVCEVELLAGARYATFSGTRATAEGVASRGYEVRHAGIGKYIVKRSQVGVRVEG